MNDLINDALNALHDARDWIAAENYEQALAAIAEARSVLFDVEEDLLAAASEDES